MDNGTFPYHLTLKEDIKFAADLNQIDPEKSGFWVLLTSLLLFILWVTFLTFYNSRVFGLFVSFAANRYLRWTKDLGHIKVGSFSISLLGGKIMIKDLVYANNNFSIRINDAWIIFSYWRCIPGKEISYTDQTSRLHLSLNGFQVHWYNRVERYKEIAQLFGMERYFAGEEIKRVVAVVTQPPGTVWDRFWALVGQIRLDIWSGRCVIGNKLLPYMFVLSWENLQSKVKICESANDRCLLSVEGQMESIRGAFEKYPDYNGEVYKDPPRTMGEGFAILQSASMNFFYNQDVLGFVTQARQSTEKNQRPLWESIWRFGPNTVISYGPWAEFHRALIWKFFFPADYQTPPVTELPQKGQRRIQIIHDVRVSFLKESSIDIWFNRGEQLESIHTRYQAGSTIEMSIWWILNEEGFSTSANFNLLNVASTTSLLYRKLFECETLRVDSSFQYPRVFNGKQVWSFKYNISKATMWFVWDHKRFFTDLINEWMGDTPADLLQFIPYEVHTDLTVTDGFEIILLLNNGNWVDPSEMQSENVECSIVGERLTFQNVMPFVDFLPETYAMQYTIRGENEMAMRMKHPLNSATAPLLAMLTRAAHHQPYASKSTHGTYSNNEQWHECWRTERVSMIFDYKFHPHMTHMKTALPYHILQEWTSKAVVHPKELTPDYLNVFIEMEGSEVQMTGLLIRFILDLKNNYFGFYDSMTDIQQSEAVLNSSEKVGQGMFNRVPAGALPEMYRPMDVDVELRVHNIRAHCLLHSMGGTEPEPCPVLYTEELVMEMKKSYEEMILQVAVGQCAVHFERATMFQPDGFLSLSGLQFRGQALLSSKDVPWDMAIIEYSWQVEVLVGELTGSLEVPSHFFALYQIIETVLLFGLAKDDETIIPARFGACQHGNLVSSCPKADKIGAICEGEDRLKYRQVRVCVDGVKLALCEEKSVIDVDLDPIRFTVCNAHENRFTDHLAMRIPTLLVRQLIRGEGENAPWLEVAKVFVDGVSLNVELPLPEDGEHLEKARLKFVTAHDEATKRLYFLYSQQKVWECACHGKTRFFGQEDTIGDRFLCEGSKLQKLFVPKINSTGQIGVHQSMLRKNSWMLRHESHLFYPDVRPQSAISQPSVPQSKSNESSSFHSAVSHQKETLPSQCRQLMISYGTYLTRSEVIKPFTESPKLGKPGALREWATNKVVRVIVKETGMNALQLNTSAMRPVISAEAVGAIKPADDAPCNRLAINGNVADNVELFVTPLAIEVVERLVSSIVACTHKLNPAFLIQHTYLNCVMKGHRQPLTENLFTSKPRPLKWDISLDLPKIQLALFQCGIADVGPSPVATNICLVMVDKAIISTAKHETQAREDQGGWHSLSMNCGIVTSQLLHLVEKTDRDFLAARTPFRSKVNWEQSDIGKKLWSKDLRVIMDVHIPDVNVTYENQRPVVSSGTTPVFENKVKVTVGTVRNCVVMARPLEKMAKNEFPLYDALSPAITAWLNVAQKLDATVEKLEATQGHWNDMSFARMMKLALECPDDSILGAKGKNKMDAVKLLGKHQASCPTCLLLKVLMRWYSLPESAKQLAAPLALKANFDSEKTRKTALRGLLSHWHPDICQMVKLASNAEAVRFRTDPGEKKKEVRINIDGNVMETRHQRNGSAASRNLTKEAAANPTDGRSKLDLYSYIRSAHREWNERKDGKKNTSNLPKDYVNPMDLMPHAFFYSFYRMCKLDWSSLDGVPLDRLTFGYDLLINELAVDLVEPKLLTSPTADSNQKLLAPYVHNLVSIRRIGVTGDVSWIIEMDDKKLMPIRGKAHVTYRGTVENVQFVVAIASICLAKEVILVGKSAGETLTDLKSHASVPLTPMSTKSNESITAKSGNYETTWDEKVYDMMRDYEKNVQRTGGMHRGDILTAIHGQGLIADVRLESRLTDLYVSFDMKSIDFTQEHNPVPVSRNTAVPHETDRLNVTLRKAKLNIRQSLSDKNNESKPILLCSLKESTANLNRRHVVITGLTSSYDTSLAIALGPIEGELPMSAGSLHEVVMKHGPQLEMEFDRLSAQPQGVSLDQGAGVLEVASPVEGGSWHTKGGPPMIRQKPPITPIIKVQFKIKLESIELQALILPSLQAVYRMSHATSQGETGGKANWNASIKHHYAEFNVTDKLKDSFVLELPSIDIIGEYLGEEGERKEPPVEKKGSEKVLQYRKGGFLKMEVALGRVNHSFTTELLNRILFATQSFRAELTSLVRSQNKTDNRPVPVAVSTSSTDKPTMLFHVTVKGVTKASMKEPWLQLTAATPTATAARFTIDELQMELTNRLVREGSEKFVGIGLIQFSAKLGQLVRAVSYEETPAELQEYATFMTMIRVSNEESSSQAHSYHISLNRPYMMIKSSAVDKAILLWLNYKNMYDFWREEKLKFEKLLEKEKEKRRNSISQVMFSPQPSQDFDINLSLSIVGGMYVCMPLVSHDITDGMPALLLSLQKSEVSVSIKKELACQAQFHGFKLNFINNFDDAALMNFQKESTAGEVMSNFFFFPQGSYKLCSKASNEGGDAKWVLSVRSHMCGMIIDLDQRIGKLAKMLVNTISSLGEEEHFPEFNMHSDQQPDDSEEYWIEGANELAGLQQPEQRVHWMEQQMHRQLRELSDLTIKKADEAQLEAARKKLRQYELLRFKEFRKTMVEKLKRSNDKTSTGSSSRRQSNASSLLPEHTALVKKVSNARSDDGRRDDVVNMHIDVQVNIESGACTLRTSPPEQNVLAKRPSAKDLRAKNILVPQVHFTKFSIPSVDLKGYYVSEPNTASPSAHPLIPVRPPVPVRPSKDVVKAPNRGCFYLSVALASMPSETVVTPHLADFVEQVLEPLPMSTGAMSVNSAATLDDGADPVNNIVGIDTSALPLDVIFHLSVQSSTIRFDGQQQRTSAADCLLKLPSLTLMGSTKRSDGSEYPGGIDISCTLTAFSLSIYSPHQQTTAHDALSLTLDHLCFVISRSKNSSNEMYNKVRFVLTSEIGTANFNYDMRRLSELLAFPKPWFRKAIARRVFFGDQTGTLKTPDASKQSTLVSTHYAARNTGDIHEKPWSATVFLTVQWKELNVNAQMSNTMGTTSWITRKGLLRSLAKLTSRHERDITLTFKLDGSELGAHGGAISGEVSLKDLELELKHKRDAKRPPRNNGRIKLGSFETRVEWMSRVILIGRCKQPAIMLGDDFEEQKNRDGEVNRVSVALNLKFSWEDLQLAITRTTIDDFQKIVNKLKLFFTEQLKNSRKVWTFDDDVEAPALKKQQDAEMEEDDEGDAKIGHWEKVLDVVTELQYNLKLLAYPAAGETTVGGSVEFEAGRISVACMNGDMTSNSWALFNLRRPSILFSPEAQFYFVNKEAGVIGVSCRQRLIIRIGDVPANGQMVMKTAGFDDRVENMANVCRVKQAKGSVMRQNASIATSLDYLIGDVLKESKLAPLITPTDPELPKQISHELLVLFHFPSLEVALTSLQNMECTDGEPSAPIVQSSFLTDFYGAVHLNTDFNAQVHFLPDLIKSYEKASQGSSSMAGTSSQQEEAIEKKDKRIYQCDTWEFFPEIKFMEKGHSWTPPLITDILKKLNVYDHRRTIPKQLQRLLLDTLDAALANGILQMLKLVDRSEDKRT